MGWVIALIVVICIAIVVAISIYAYEEVKVIKKDLVKASDRQNLDLKELTRISHHLAEDTKPSEVCKSEEEWYTRDLDKVDRYLRQNGVVLEVISQEIFSYDYFHKDELIGRKFNSLAAAHYMHLPEGVYTKINLNAIRDIDECLEEREK